MSSQRPPRRTYAKPITLPNDLSLLHGQVTGIVELPPHLQWLGNARYDLDAAGRIVDLYRTVINEAASATDLHRYLNEAVLVELWLTIWLPAAIRAAWETRFPQLLIRPSTAA